MTKSLRLTVALGLALEISGALHVYGVHDSLGSTRENMMATALLVLAVLWLTVRPEKQPAIGDTVPQWLTYLPLCFAVIAISDIFTFVDQGWSPLRFAIFGGSTVGLFALAYRRAPVRVLAGAALLVGMALRYIHIKYTDLDPALGDMLPLVQRALDNLMNGQSPYTTYEMPWELPLTYLPLTWLAYMPFYLIGIDIRWTNVVAEVALLGATLFAARRVAPGQRGGEVALAVWAWLFLTPSIIHWDMITSAPIGWAMIAWALALVVAGEERWGPVALGLAAATTPLIVVFVPFIALCWWRTGGLSNLLRQGTLAVIVAAVVLLPWIIWSPDAFWEGNVRWFNDTSGFPTMKWEAEQIWVQISGFSGEFWVRGIEGWLKPIQGVLVLLVVALYARRGATRADLLPHATAAFLLFMLFNPVLWPYLYNPALVAALLAAATPGSVPVSRPVRQPHIIKEEAVA